MRYVFLCLGLFASLACRALAQSAPASHPSDAQESFVYDRIDNHVRFEDDGTGLRDTVALIRIQSQAGLQEFGQLIFGYSSATENLEVQYVRVRKPDGQVVETPLSTAQDFAPEILREAPAYSDYRQRHVSVAGLQVGDVLEYHSLIHVTTALAPHQFWYEHFFPRNAVVHEDRLQIDVPGNREVKLKSPNRNYETQESAGRRIYTWDIRDITPDRGPAKQDTDPSDLTPDIQLSSFTDWQQVAHWYNQLQGAQAAPDDSIRKKAEELTHGAATPAEKARRLYSYVALNIRYVSLSFGVGRLQPHSASDILKNGYGDCKDKHTLLQALLRVQGIDSYPVLIHSFRNLDPDVPSPAQFDHLITAAKVGPDLTWLDSTEEVAPYGLIFAQLRGKQALLSSGDARAGLIRTPEDAPVRNALNLSIEGSFGETGAFEANVELDAEGDSDMPLRGSFRRTSATQWTELIHYLLQSWGLDGDVSDVHTGPLEDTTKPFHLAFHLRQENFFRVPSASTDFRLLPPIGLPPARAENEKHSQESLEVGPPIEQTFRARVQFPANYSVRIPSAVKMSREFGEYSSRYTLSQNMLDAERRMILRVNRLPVSRRYDYESFRNSANTEIEQLLSCTISAPSGRRAEIVTAGASPAELQRLGLAALDRRDYANAADLLARALAADAARKDAWDQLGLAYAALNRHDDAIAAFRKQIALDAYHKSANSDLAAELQKQGKLDDAVAAYRAQLGISPTDQQTHKNLGVLLAQMKRDQDACAELEAAAAIPPADPEVTMALAQVYARLGNSARAESLMTAVTGVATSTGSDIFSAALPATLNPDQTLRDARDTLNQIGDHFDSGDYERLPPSAFSAMNLVALAWARIGWAKFLQGEGMDAMQYLNSAWLLSQSGSVANRLGTLFEREGQPDKARHMFALAAAAGGPEAKFSRDRLASLVPGPAALSHEVEKAAAELTQNRIVALPAIATSGSATFALVFDTSSKPYRVEWLEGDAPLAAVAGKLREKEFPVRFPDISSLKIVRRANLACTPAACTVTLLPLGNPTAIP